MDLVNCFKLGLQSKWYDRGSLSRQVKLYTLLQICVRKSWDLKLFLKIQGAISSTTAPILGLFVLLLMYFSCWIQIWQWKFEFPKILEKFENFGLSFALNIRAERVKVGECTLWVSYFGNLTKRIEQNIPLSFNQREDILRGCWKIHFELFHHLR